MASPAGDLWDRFRRGMTKTVSRRVFELRLTEPIYCVALVYDTEANEFLPPLLGVGLASERRRNLVERPSRLRHVLWNPAEFSLFDVPELETHDQDLLETCDLLNERYVGEEQGCSEARALLNATALQLMQIDWSRVCPITEDFVVFATDLEGSDTAENLSTSVPERTLSRLREKGWL